MTYLQEICVSIILLEIKYINFTHFSSYDCAIQRTIDLQVHYMIDHPKAGQTFCQNRSISLHFRDKRFLRFMQKFKIATKSGRKVILGKSCQYTLQIPCGSKILCRYRSISLCFRDKHVFAFYTEIQGGRQK